MASRAALHRYAVYDGTWPVPRSYALVMSKRYEPVRNKIPMPGGRFAEALRMALVDLTCFGERHLDLAGYPHESEAAAIMGDWSAVGVDFRTAAAKVIDQEVGERNDGRALRGAKAAAEE